MTDIFHVAFFKFKCISLLVHVLILKKNADVYKTYKVNSAVASSREKGGGQKRLVER